MSLARKIAGNASLQFGARICGNIIGVVVVALLTRYLGQEGFGNYTTIFAYLFFFGALADLGLHVITISELNKKETDVKRFYSSVYTMRLITGVVLLSAAGLLIWVFPYPTVVKHGVLIVTLSTFFMILNQLNMAYYQTQLSMARPALADISGKVLMLVGMLIGMSQGYPLLALLWAVVAGHALQYVINITGIVRARILRLTIDREYWTRIIKRTWPIALAQLCTLIYFKMDVVFLSLLRPEHLAQFEVGSYGAPYKFLEVLVALVPIFMGLVTPLVAQAWSEQNKEVLHHRLQRAFDALSLVTWPLVLGGIVLAEPLMELIAPGFAESANILRILMVAIGLIYFTYLPSYSINAIGAQRTMLKNYAFAAVLATVLYVTTIPIFGVYAAAGVTVLVELTVMTLAWRVLKAQTAFRLDLRVFAKAGIAALVMAAIVYAISQASLITLIATGGFIYVFGIFVTRAITRDTIRELISTS